MLIFLVKYWTDFNLMVALDDFKPSNNCLTKNHNARGGAPEK